MPSVCLIFKIHEPYRLRHYSFFDIGESASYRDEPGDFSHLDAISHQCYIPAAQILLKQVKALKNDFRVTIALSGVLIDLLERFQPELLSQFKRLADTGCVEFVCEPYFHSLAFLFSKQEFREQIKLHRSKTASLFGTAPNTLLHHTLPYNNDVAREADAQGFSTMIASTGHPSQGGATLNRVYQPAPTPALKLLFESPILAENLARFAKTTTPAKPPLSALNFVTRLARKQGDIFMLSANLNAFAEHPLGKSGALEFLSEFPAALLASPGGRFETPSQAASLHPPCETVDLPGFASWEEAEHESIEWLGNEMQKDAIHGLYKIEATVKAMNDPELLLTWRHLQVSDHFYYMNTKRLTDPTNGVDSGPYHSPYDAYINFMNILTDFSERLLPR